MNLGDVRSATPKATKRPTQRDLGWIAGLIEGEGNFHRSRTSEVVTAAQKSPEILYRLQGLLGGTVSDRKPSGLNLAHWQVSGFRARGIMLTLYPLMSEKRKAQIRKSFGRPE